MNKRLILFVVFPLLVVGAMYFGLPPQEVPVVTEPAASLTWQEKKFPQFQWVETNSRFVIYDVTTQTGTKRMSFFLTDDKYINTPLHGQPSYTYSFAPKNTEPPKENEDMEPMYQFRGPPPPIDTKPATK